MTTADTEKTAISSFEAIARESGHNAIIQIYPPGADMGKKWEIKEGTMFIGRDATNDIVVEKDAVSRKHAMLSSKNGVCEVRDLDSTNGTFVNHRKVVSTALSQGDQIKIGDRIFKFLNGSNAETAYHEEIYRMTIIDGLTGIYNKRFFIDELVREAGRTQRYDRPLSLIMFDIDHFKNINDTYGHVAGDHVLQELCAVITPRIRKSEVFARYGGEEFAILLPETPTSGALVVAEKIRRAVEEHSFVYDKRTIPMTISLGIATLDDPKTSIKNFISSADEKLYAAKSKGRNCVVG